MKTSVVWARVPVALKQDFEATAAAHGQNLSHAIRQLMKQYVTQEKKMARRRHETLEALEDIETERIVEGEKVLNWLTGWGTDDEHDPPK